MIEWARRRRLRSVADCLAGIGVEELQALGIAPDILLVRADREIPADERRKLSLFCNVRESAVIQALDVPP